MPHRQVGTALEDIDKHDDYGDEAADKSEAHKLQERTRDAR